MSPVQDAALTPIQMDRRLFLRNAGAFGALAGLSAMTPAWARPSLAAPARVSGLAPTVRRPGLVEYDLYIDRTRLAFGGETGTAVTMNGTVPGPLLRFTEGDEAVVRVHNRLDEQTSVHWHGLILPNDMDGVPDDFLVEHLKSNQILYSSPHPMAHVSIMLLAVGYGMDLDERAGCPHFTMGAIAAPCFPLLTFVIMKYAQHRRRRSGMMLSGGGKSFPLGKSVFSGWADLLLDHDTTSRPATAEPDT